MAPVLNKSSPLVTAEVTIAGVKVVALIDTGATSSCCRWGWYNQWKSHLGPLKETNTLVIGVGNVPVELKGITDSLKLEWDSIVDHCEMMVLTTLEDVDVILGMDIISRLNVQISGRSKDAFHQPESNSYEVLKLNHKVVIPAGKSRVFFVANTVTELTLFEPSDRLPEGLIGLPTLSEGSRVAVQLDNLTEGDITLNPEWEVGAISSVHLTQSPTGDQMPQIPDSFSFEQQRDLRHLLDEYKDVFSREGQPISNLRRNKASDQEGPERNIGAGAVERMGIPSETVQRFFRIVLLTLSSQLQSRRKTKPEPGWDVRGSCVEQIVPFGYVGGTFGAIEKLQK